MPRLELPDVSINYDTAGTRGSGVLLIMGFGVPGEMALAAMIPMGQPLKQLTKLTRKPVADFVRKEHWNGEALID